MSERKDIKLVVGRKYRLNDGQEILVKRKANHGTEEDPRVAARIVLGKNKGSVYWYHGNTGIFGGASPGSSMTVKCAVRKNTKTKTAKPAKKSKLKAKRKPKSKMVIYVKKNKSFPWGGYVAEEVAL